MHVRVPIATQGGPWEGQMRNLTIGARLAAAFGLVLAVLVTASWLAIDRLGALDAQLDLVAHTRWPGANAAVGGLLSSGENTRDLAVVCLDRSGASRAASLAPDDREVRG